MSHSPGTQRYWDEHAATDPLWAVLSFPDKRGGRWSLADFMKTGEREIALLFQRFAELQLTIPAQRALDFGCGVGRLTQALARRQQHAIGADISAVMIDLARRLNQYPGRAEYICTEDTAISQLDARAFDCIYSNIVLQHVPAEISVTYLHQFFRLLAPGGLLVFQLPSHREAPVDAEIKAMPDEAYRASIALAAPPPVTVRAGSAFIVPLRVRNNSTHTWSQPRSGPLAVGNHWLDASGELMVRQDDGRAPLLQIVPPGLEWSVLMTVHAPAEPGRYVCEIDLVHEGISWYAHKGSPTLRVDLEVTPSLAGESESGVVMMQEFPVPEYPEHELPPASSSLPPSSGEFPMHGVPRDQVLDIVRHYGGRLAYLEEDRRAGPDWVSYRYFVVGRS